MRRRLTVERFAQAALMVGMLATADLGLYEALRHMLR
jgi:hypothetical protein